MKNIRIRTVFNMRLSVLRGNLPSSVGSREVAFDRATSDTSKEVPVVVMHMINELSLMAAKGRVCFSYSVVISCHILLV